MDTAFDIIIAGGGVNGAGIARDAAGRGARVLLLEADDLASGTSSASTKLVHGGLRYLEYGEFSLVREALREREVLWSIAPHLVQPMRFVLPHDRHLRPRWILRAGLFLYDRLGGRKHMPSARAIRLARHPAGAALRPEFSHGFEYSDGWVDDARLVVLNARDAADRGATIMTRTALLSARRQAGLWRVETPAGSFHGRALVNAAGPGADDLARLASEAPGFTMRRVRGSHIITRKLFDHPFAYIFQLPDTRICFAIPYERDFTLIGTTDRDHTGALVHVEAAADEIAYLCEAASRYFASPVTPADVVRSYAGVRALVDAGSGRPEAASRGYRLPLSTPKEGAPLLHILGGKITSYRHLGEAAVDRLAPLLGLEGPSWTANAPLPGGDFPIDGLAELAARFRARHPFLDERQASRIARAYGTQAQVWLGKAQERCELGHDFGAGLSEAELRYMMAKEWAHSAEDVLWRRSKLGLHMGSKQQAALARWMDQAQA